MTKSEMAKVLSTAAAFDNRNVDKAMVEAWHLAIGRLDFTDCQQAVAEHYQNDTAWLMPAHIKERVRLIGNARWERHQSEQLAIQAQAYREIRALEAGTEPGEEPRPPFVRAPSPKGHPVMAFKDAMADMDQMITKSVQAQAAKPEETP